VHSPNVQNIAIEGDFDACQDIVKELFADGEFRESVNLSAVNSINWARVMAQIVYYVYSAVRLGAPDREIAFSIPTGNFGNVFAAYAAHRMGLPIKHLVVGSNSNDILTRFFESDDMSIQGVQPTLSPSMDIQVSSNFERLLFELYHRDGNAVAVAMKQFRAQGKLSVGEDRLNLARANFSAARFNDEETLAEIREVHEKTGYVMDPHTAIGSLAGKKFSNTGVAMIIAATAHPAKFKEAILKATGKGPEIPRRLAQVYEKEERFKVLPSDAGAVKTEVYKLVESLR